MGRWLLLISMVLLSVAAVPAPAPSPEGVEFFEKKIRPVLAESCFKCHSATSDKVKGSLKLDSRVAALRGGESGKAAIVPGEPDKSLLIEAVRWENGDLQMPPKKPLSDQQVADLVAWIKMGAPYGGPVAATPATAPVFWAAVPPKEVSVPAGANPVDYFIQSKLREKNLLPAPPAFRRALIRRATFDLTGLPPTPKEVNEFLADQSPNAFAKVVDRLLASPQYGERWARHWLDIVRYTDSFDSRGQGSEGDCTEAYKYRDWVTNAFNSDMPYDRFLTNQVAGDLLPSRSEPNVDGIIATTVVAIGNWGNGDSDKEKQLTDIVDDQVDVVGRAFLGVTIACARCHDHKFDPISSEDYYGLAGIFFSSHILVGPGPKTDGSKILRIPLVSKAEVEKRKKAEARIAELQKGIDQSLNDYAMAQARGMLPNVAEYLQAATAGEGAQSLNPILLQQWKTYLGGTRLFTQRSANAANISGLFSWRGATDTPNLLINTNDQAAGFVTITMPARSVAVHPSPKAGVAVAWKSPIDGRISVRGKVADADDKCGNGIEYVLNRRIDRERHELKKGAIPNGGAMDFAAPSVDVVAGDWIELIVLPKGDYSCDTTVIELEIKAGEKSWSLTRDLVANPLEGNPNSGMWYFYDLAGEGAPAAAGSALAAYLKSHSDADALAVQKSLAALNDQAKDVKDLGKLAGPDAELYRALFSPQGTFVSAIKSNEAGLPEALRGKVTQQRDEMASLRKITAEKIPVAHGLQEGGCPETPYVTPQDVKIHLRGRYDRLGKVVPRGFPAILKGPTVGPITGSGRLQLAQWLSSKENPQTARVMVNRIWQHHFGEGIVRTPNNFGKLGTPPTHPELLDYLAVQFMKNGWSIKSMHRTMMLSATYQQSSLGNPAALRADPENLLVGRMPRQRLDAEELRDALLYVSNGLDATLGGPAVKELTSGRRSLYLLMVRSDRSNYRMLFDAPDPMTIAEKRIDSTVAPQALFLMNHPFALERTRALAELSAKNGVTPRARIEWLYQTLYARPASEREIDLAETALSAATDQKVAWETYCQVLLCANEFAYID
jgi:hypothetical protein